MALKYLHNKIYAQNETMQEIINITQPELDRLEELQAQAFDNNFVLTSDVYGIQRWEKLFNITADINEYIEFRKQRILSRFSSIGPYTKFFLIKFLDAAVGSGNYRIAINVYSEYNLFIRLADDYLVLESEIRAYLRNAIPANITLNLERLWANWQDILSRRLTWGKVLGATSWGQLLRGKTWGSMEEYTWGELEQFKFSELEGSTTWGNLSNKFWRDIMGANTWGDIKQYIWED